MTEFINNNSAACPDLLPNAPFATAAADNQPGLHLSYGFGSSPGGHVGIRANGTAANPTRLKNGDFVAVYGSGGYNGGSTNHGYTLGSGGIAVWADEDWSTSGTGTFISLDTRTRGVPGDSLLALHRIHVTSDGITINDANGLEPTGGRLGAGRLNVAGAIAINGAVIASTGASTLWTPSDQSGAGLVFTNVSAQFYQLGPLVFAYGIVRYPITASVAAAQISLPVPVPNQTYGLGPCATNVDRTVLAPVQNSSPGVAQFFFNTAAQTNVALSNLFVEFMLIYPAS